jgi:putative flavoprotein involved in K+ transport
MSSQEIEVLVVGAGQAGIAMSEHLGLQGVPHLVVVGVVVDAHR